MEAIDRDIEREFPVFHENVAAAYNATDVIESIRLLDGAVAIQLAEETNAN